MLEGNGFLFEAAVCVTSEAAAPQPRLNDAAPGRRWGGRGCVRRWAERRRLLSWHGRRSGADKASLSGDLSGEKKQNGVFKQPPREACGEDRLHTGRIHGRAACT